MERFIRDTPTYLSLAWPYTLIVVGAFFTWYLAMIILHTFLDKSISRLASTINLEQWGKASRMRRLYIATTEIAKRIRLRSIPTQFCLVFPAFIFIWVIFGALALNSSSFVGIDHVPVKLRVALAVAFMLWATTKWLIISIDIQQQIAASQPGIFINSISRQSQAESLNPVILRRLARNSNAVIVFFSIILSIANVKTFSETSEAGAAMAGGYVGLILGSGPAWRCIDRRMPQSVLIEALLQYWIPAATKRKEPAAIYARDRMDPSTAWRTRVQIVLDAVTATLPGLSRLFSNANHPVLRNLAALRMEIASELRTPQSLATDPPAKITQSLRDIGTVIFGRQSSEYHARLSARLAPLHADYVPPSFSVRLKSGLRNVTSGIEQANVSGKALAYLALLGVSIFWFLQDGDFSKLDPILK